MWLVPRPIKNMILDLPPDVLLRCFDDLLVVFLMLFGRFCACPGDTKIIVSHKFPQCSVHIGLFKKAKHSLEIIAIFCNVFFVLGDWLLSVLFFLFVLMLFV